MASKIEDIWITLVFNFTDPLPTCDALCSFEPGAIWLATMDRWRLWRDWFDARRLQDGYVPTGFKGASVTARAVKGHRFGLDLSASDRQALISFLKTL